MSQDRFLENGEPSPGDITVPDVVNFESKALDLPAPEIDLGGGAPDFNAEKPLGPRRLALLREQMEQHAEDLAQNQSADPEHVDEDLAQKQMRMAQLASRAALSSDEDRMVAERAMAESSGASDDAQPMTASIPADQVRRRDLRGERSADVAEPDLDAAPDVVPEPEVIAQPDVEAAPETPATDSGAAEAADSPAGADDQEPVQAEPEPEAEPVSEPELDAKPADEPESVPETEAEFQAGPEAQSPAEADVETSAGVDAGQAEPEPAQPVSALDAQGLELMDPEDYRQSSHLKTIMLVLAAVVLLAVAVIVLMILL